MKSPKPSPSTQSPVSPEMTLTIATCDPAVGLLAREYAPESGFRMLVFSRREKTAQELAARGLIGELAGYDARRTGEIAAS